MDTLIATKEKMSQRFVDGERTPVTIMTAGPCVVTQIKDEAVQVGFGNLKESRSNKPALGHVKKIGAYKKSAPRFLRELPKGEEELKVGDEVKVSDVFSKGDTVQVTGVSKGKGFAGVVKRWSFAGGPKTHGQSDRERAPGSIGQGTTPGRVHKGKKMPGRMGSDMTTVKNLKVVSVDNEKNLLEVSGPVPGSPGTTLMVKRTSKANKDE